MVKLIFISGPPGSGKSTQAKFINDELDFSYFDSGDMVRQYLKEGKMDGGERMARGLLMPIKPVLIMAKKELGKIIDLDPKGIVLSGIPRSIEQAFGIDEEEGVIDWLSSKYNKDKFVFIDLTLPEEESIRRNTSRDEGRVDDKLEVLPTRLKIFRETTMPVFDELKKRGYKIIEIDGTPPPEEVFNKIEVHLR